MKPLAEIFHQQGLNIAGRTLSRTAVRAIILDRKKLFMIFSKKNGDYKFPGGGVENDETHQDALTREVWEETGVKVAIIGAEFVQVIEYDLPLEPEYEVFKMTSRYFMCAIGPEVGAPKLDQYEKELGFVARWIDIEAALETNRALLSKPNIVLPRWVKREVVVLEQIQNSVFRKR